MRARVLGCAPSGKIVPKIYDLSLAIGELTMYLGLLVVVGLASWRQFRVLGGIEAHGGLLLLFIGVILYYIFF